MPTSWRAQFAPIIRAVYERRHSTQPGLAVAWARIVAANRQHKDFQNRRQRIRAIWLSEVRRQGDEWAEDRDAMQCALRREAGLGRDPECYCNSCRCRERYLMQRGLSRWHGMTSEQLGGPPGHYENWWPKILGLGEPERAPALPEKKNTLEMKRKPSPSRWMHDFTARKQAA